MSSSKRFELILFFACWIGFAWFNQGGGWNQNSRFAEVRAIVEEGRASIDNFLVYRRSESGDDLQRLKLDRAEYTLNGTRYRLAWVDMAWELLPIGEHPLDPGVEKAPMIEVCASGDVGYVEATGHFHPNKPPGTSFLALPAYAGIYHLERLLGIDPDHWFTLNVNAWLTTIFSIGLLSALGCVLFFRLARDFAGGAARPALLATIALAFGTTFFPFGTILFDHNATAVLLLAAFYLIARRPQEISASSRETNDGGPPSSTRCALSGCCAGFAAITNYVAAVCVVFLALYCLLARSSWKTPRQWAWRSTISFSCGVMPPLVLILWFNAVNFGSPFALANDFQNPLFKDPGGALGMFVFPNPYVAALIAVSPFRGVFWLCPILILGVAGWLRWMREKTFGPEARLGIAIFAFFFLVNASFNGYHGGFSAGPRYLVPGLPFLALPLVVAFVHWRRTALVLLTISLAQQFLLTATDAQNSLAVGGHARVDNEHRKDDFFCNLVTEYAAPLFFTGRIGPLTEQLLSLKLEREAERLIEEIPDEAERARELEQTRREWRQGVDRGDPDVLLLSAIRGPVSVNPVNVFDGLLGAGVWPLHTPQTDWASFNAGELLWPKSRLSVLPLLLIVGGLFHFLFRQSRSQAEQAPHDPPEEPRKQSAAH